MHDWIRPEIYQWSAYQVPDPGQAIKLNTMENPYGWEPALREEWLELLRQVSLNRYPDAAARQLKHTLREVMHIPDAMGIMVGNGSDELIQMLTLAAKGTILIPEPSFVMYRHLAQVAGKVCVGIALTEEFNLVLSAMLEAIETVQPALIFLACPNNPTGNVFAVKDLEAIVERAPGAVVIDEAYAPFTEFTWMSRLDKYPQVLVMRTVSKWGLAGLRLGVLVGHPRWIEQLEKVRQPYNINVLTQVSAVFALQHYAFFEQQVHQIKTGRQELWQRLGSLRGVLKLWPSEANFILFRVRQAERIFNQLYERGILVKCVHGRHPLLHDCLQVTVGTSEENQTFLETLGDILREG